MGELEYEIKQNLQAIKQELQSVTDNVMALQDYLNVNALNKLPLSTWTEGYVARDVAKVTALLAKHQALTTALYIMKEK